MTDPSVSSKRPVRRWLLIVATAALVASSVAIPQAAHAADHYIVTEVDLQNAANAAAAGDTLHIMNDLAISAPVTFPTGVIIVGDVPGDIDITRLNNAAYNLFIFEPTAPAQDYTVQDLNFDGATGIGAAISLVDVADDVSNLTLTNVFVHDFTSGAFSAINIERLTSGLSVSDSVFADNTSTSNGGAIGGVSLFNAIIDIQSSAFSGNTAAGVGGAVYLPGDNAFTVTVNDCTFTGNVANDPGTGGGALHTSGLFTTATLTNNQFQNNTTAGSGGGAYITGMLFDITVDNSTFTGNEATTGNGGGLFASAGQDLLLDDSVFETNTASAGGGAYVEGVQSLTMNRDTFTLNTGFAGGGVWIGPSGSVNLDQITATQNSADVGGAIGADSLGHISLSRFEDNSAVTGGAIFVETQTSDFAVGRSTFDGNSASSVAPDASFGAAIAVEEARDGSAIRFYNSTFSNNILNPGLGGAGISLAILDVEDNVFMDYGEDTFDEPLGTGAVIYIAGVPQPAQFSLNRVTIVAAGGIQLGTVDGLAQIYNTILDGDAADTGLPSLQTTGGNPVDVSWSIIDEPVSAAYNDLGGNQFGVANAQLGPLQNNGGVTFTRLPLPSSPAIDLGDPAPAFAPAFDQRLTPFTRILNGRIDIGAVEASALLATSGSDFSWPTLYLGLFGVFAGLAMVGADRRRVVR